MCDVAALTVPDAVTVDSLARLKLTARRCGHELRLRHPCEPLRGLLDITGLKDVVPVWDVSDLEALGQTEQREQAGGIEEERDPGDLSV